MNPEIEALWDRSRAALEAAAELIDLDPDGAASRAYYAAFHAVSALFANEGQVFRKHTALATAVHRDLVRTGRWARELGKHYNRLVRARQTGDYGSEIRVSRDDAREAVRRATAVRAAVAVELRL